MDIFISILFGIGAGSVARMVMPGPRAGGIYVAMLVGVCGGMVGNSLATVFGPPHAAGLDFHGLLMAIAGTLILLFAYRCLALRVVPANNFGA